MPLGSAENPPEMGEKGGGEYDLAIGLAVTEAEARRSHSSHFLALRKPFEHVGVVFPAAPTAHAHGIKFSKEAATAAMDFSSALPESANRALSTR